MIKRNSNLEPSIEWPDHYSTTLVNNDFDSINNSSSAHSVSFTLTDVNEHNLLDYQVVLHDVLSTRSPEMFQMLKFNLDKTRTVNSRQSLGTCYLNNLFAKDPSAWPKMSDNNSWEKPDSALSNLLVGAVSLFECVELLEKSIYAQRLSNFCASSKKGVSGLTRRAQQSNLWKKTMSRWPELIVLVISVPKIPCRFCWKMFAQEIESSTIVSLVGKDIRK